MLNVCVWIFLVVCEFLYISRKLTFSIKSARRCRTCIYAADRATTPRLTVCYINIACFSLICSQKILYTSSLMMRIYKWKLEIIITQWYSRIGFDDSISFCQVVQLFTHQVYVDNYYDTLNIKLRIKVIWSQCFRI